MSKKRVFRGSNGPAYTRALFKEFAEKTECEKAMYTIGKEDIKDGRSTYLSIQRLYAQYDNPVEYEFAVAHFEDYKHWLIIRDSVFFKPTYETMRIDLEARLANKAVEKIKEIDSFQAQKWLAEKGYGEKPKAGAPSKAVMEGEKKKALAKDQAHIADLARARALANKRKV